VRGSDIVHIAAGSNWLEWGKQMLCAHIRLGMQFRSQRGLHENHQNSSEVMPTVQMQDDFGHLIP
jgi:hypothetical protein